MSEQTPADPNSPLMLAWKAYQQTEEYRNTRAWYGKPLQEPEGTLWAAFEQGFNAQAADLSRVQGENEKLREQLGLTRMCVNCGKYADAATVRPGDHLPECVGPEGFATCTFDMTPHEAALLWRQRWHDLNAVLARVQGERERLRADLLDCVTARDNLLALVSECDSELSAYAHGRGLSKDAAKALSLRCRMACATFPGPDVSELEG